MKPVMSSSFQGQLKVSCCASFHSINKAIQEKYIYLYHGKL